MSEVKVGDVVDVDNDGNRHNYSGRGRVTRVVSERWFVVAPLERGGRWTRDAKFPLRRLTLVTPAGATPGTVMLDGSHPGDAMLGFASGALRNRKENELQYEGFLSPLALQMYAEYMHEHRFTADGSVRDSDNWQKGIPDESYRDSLLRHIMDLWLIYRGWPTAAREDGDLRKALAGAFFNVQGLMHNLALRDLGSSKEVSQ